MKEFSLVEVIEAALESHALGLHVAMPGRVVSYNATRQTATIQPTVALPLSTETDGIAYDKLTAFPDVPVAWPSGGGFFVSFPLAEGDPVLLVFSEVATGDYLKSGEDSRPLDTRRHSLGYPVAIPGAARPDPNVFADASATELLIGKDGSEPQIKISGTEIKLGKTASNHVALANLVLAELNAIKAAYDNHTHGGVTVGAGVTATPLPTMTAPGSVAATITKAT